MVPQRMLEALVAMGGQSVEKSRFTDILWPDAHGDAGGQVFDTTLHRLRKILGNPAALVLHDGKLSLAREHVWTDLWAVERSLGADGQHSNIGVVERFKNAHKLIELYRGPLYAGSEQTVWVVPRARLHERVVQAVERAAEDLATGGEWTRARILFAEGIAWDPTVEAFTKVSCDARRSSGRRRKLLVLTSGVAAS